jgi:hypothetical protein
MLTGTATWPTTAATVLRRDGNAFHTTEVKTCLWHPAHWVAGLWIVRQRSVTHALPKLKTPGRKIRRGRNRFVNVGGHRTVSQVTTMTDSAFNASYLH